jgi:hypothetical protein
MNRLETNYRLAGNWLNILLLGSVLVPLLVLSLYNHPSPADDYCYIDTVFKYGWAGAMHWYYIGWTGRYFGILLNHSNPLLFHWVEGFKVLPVLLLAGLVAALYVLFRQLTPTLSRLTHLGLAGVVFFLYILHLPSIAEAFYWMAAFVTYTIPNILTLLWIVVVLRWYRQESTLMKVLTGTLAGFLVFAIVGSSEINMLVMVLLVGGWWGYRLLFRRSWDGLMLALAVVVAFSCYLYFTAPGNQERMGGDTLSGNVLFSVKSSFSELARLVYTWLGLPLLLYSVAWLLVLTRLNPLARTYFKVPFWYALLLTVGLLVAPLFAGYYGNGAPAPRVVNCVYLYFLIGWFYTLGVLADYLLRRYPSPWQVPIAARVGLVVLLGTLLLPAIYHSTNLRLMYKDWLSGTAAAYNQEMYARYRLIENTSEPVVYLPALQNQPFTLFVEDIKADPKHWWNRCLAGYHGKEVVYLKPSESIQ